MAKAKMYKVKALVNIKYDKTIAKVGDEFKVRKDDVEHLTKSGYVELLEELKEEDTSKDGAGEKEGE